MRSHEKSSVSKISGSGRKKVRVPWVRFHAGSSPRFASAAPPFWRTGPFGSPRTNSWTWRLPSRRTSTRIWELNAFTTLTPTPCRPPETLYPPPPNFPPAWSTVMITSRALLPVECRSTGMPRPSSTTSSLPSEWIVTSMRVAWLAIASSIELSTTSHTS